MSVVHKKQIRTNTRNVNRYYDRNNFTADGSKKQTIKMVHYSYFGE